MKLKSFKRLSLILLGLFIVSMLFPLTVFSESNADPKRNISLTITYLDEGAPLINAEFDIYLVATVDAQNRMTPTPSFRGYSVNYQNTSNEALRALATTLEGYILRDNIPPTGTGRTDSEGKVYFPDTGVKMQPGLYMAMGQRHIQSGFYYDASPFMIFLPHQNEDTEEWNYNVTVNSKYDSGTVPNNPENPVLVERKVLKVWNDNGYEHKRPKQVIVQLLRDRTIFDTVILNAENNWRFRWEGLDDQYRWTVVEKEPNNYTVQVTREGITFVVTNTYTGGDTPGQVTTTRPTPTTLPNETTDTNRTTRPVNTMPDRTTEKYTRHTTTKIYGSIEGDSDVTESSTKPNNKPETLPKTGQLWWPVPFLICFGLLFIVIGLVQRRGAVDEE